MTIPTYSCTQQELYSISKLAWNSCTQHLADFTAFKPRYDATFITDQERLISNAETLPDDQARSSVAEAQRIQLTDLADKCLANWQKLKRYIADAFPTNLQKPELEQAGQDYYSKAGNYNWDSIQGLLTSGQEYITNKQTTLEANNNMPPTFATDFATDKDAFNTLHRTFLDSEETARQGTATKIEANNTVHANLMSMLLDGQEIFRNDQAVRKQFVFSDLLYLIRGAGVAGLRGTVTNQADGVAIPNVAVSIAGTNKRTTTDDQGKYTITPVPAGTYNFIFDAPGFQQQIIEAQEIKTGTVSTLKCRSLSSTIISSFLSVNIII